jgi:K+-sensing histidine kinase KdpD
MESQRVTYHHYQANMVRIDLIDLISQQLEYRPINKPISWQLGETDGILMTDAGYLGVIVNNLLMNAEKYAKPDSEVIIVLAEQEQQICFSIQNQVEAHHLPDAKKLYDPYYRAPTAHKVSGSGLGLFIVKSLVERLSGKIHYTILPDNWVSFQICLPKEVTNET